MMTRKSVQRRRGDFMLRACTFMALCVGGIVLLASDEAVEGRRQDGLLPRDLQQGSLAGQETPLCRTVPAPGVGDQTRNKSTDADINKVTLSKEQLSTTVECIGKGSAVALVPKKKEEACVIKPGATVENCNSEGSSSLRSLLQANREITWTDAVLSSGDGHRQTRRLELTEDDLPFTDKSFFVGCTSEVDGHVKSAPAAAKTCRIDVSVLARSSKVEENVVTCAYGAESNPRPLEVELTSRNNTVVVACGADGSIAPPSYNTHYCDDTLQSCDKSYTDIFPKFDSTWWSGEAGKDDAPVKLTIPKESFPVEDQRFYVGCSPKKNGDGSSGGSRAGAGPETQAPAASPTRCKVMVTVRAAAASSSVSSIVGDVVAAAGATAIASFVGGLF
ncbi:SAG-related sequence [Besnoitia besnoiti]|uniref:SAG-related sequence n=1 Tax=Besnoitia besnoiti TaxID=94643 RepID=A0A2A9MEU5_BESBE|nr:SAG-related sequence [Besnoitia besnoiti]PFH37038.1 SAG-related sequence [Besnoitia besnoiti]